jgi:trehalose 6-phosphate phosphatase
MTIELPLPPLPRRGERWALFLDIDGTLVGFDDDPARVVVDAPVVALVGRIRDRNEGALAILSGRSLVQVDALLDPLRLPSGALHGLELRGPTGAVALRRPPPDVAADIEAQVRSALPGMEGVAL